MEHLIDEDTAERNRAARKLLRLHRYEAGPEGGSLHIALADGNLDDDDIDFCIKSALERQEWICAAAACLMRQMSYADRNLARFFWEGC